MFNESLNEQAIADLRKEFLSSHAVSGDPTVSSGRLQATTLASKLDDLETALGGPPGSDGIYSFATIKALNATKAVVDELKVALSEFKAAEEGASALADAVAIAASDNYTRLSNAVTKLTTKLDAAGTALTDAAAAVSPRVGRLAGAPSVSTTDNNGLLISATGGVVLETKECGSVDMCAAAVLLDQLRIAISKLH